MHKPESAYLIDNIFSNVLKPNLLTGVLYTDISDHFPVFVIDYDQRTAGIPQYITTRQYSERNILSFQSKLQQTDFSGVLHMNDAQQAFTEFHQTYIGLYDSCFSVKTVKVGYRNKNLG